MELNELITSVNDAVWGYVLIFVLVGCGVWFTWKTRFVQFRMVGEMLRLLTDSAVDTVESQVKNGRGKESRNPHSTEVSFLSWNRTWNAGNSGYSSERFSSVMGRVMTNREPPV